jgi:C4-dicarboxylate-binding protein DctP
VQSSLPEAYTSMQTGVYNGWIMFPSGWVNFKLNEVAKHYAEVGFGSITWHGLTINTKKFSRLPKDVQAILVEVGREYEALTGKVNKENYPKQLKALAELGVNVTKVPDSVQRDWAMSLKDWPQQMAKDLDSRGFPGTKTLQITLKEAEAMGHKWPVRYEIK